jgi:NAD(P)H-hydrate epimerase
MKLATAEQMREADRYAIEKLGITGIYLMEKAAGHIVAAAMEHIPTGGSVVVFCGTGNNGGDGMGAAAYLLNKGIPVRVFLIGDAENLTPDSLEMKNRLISSGGSLEPFSLSVDLDALVSTCSVVIDAIIGIGLSSKLKGEASNAVSLINSSQALVISADIPSGVHADTGAVLGDAVKADITVTFSMAKPGHFVEPGCIYCGEVRVRDIGIPHSVIEQIDSFMYATMLDDIHLPQRHRDTHKGDYGRSLIIAGSIGYTGAPALSAKAATKTGSGLVYVGVPKSIYDVMAVKLDEEMPFPLPDDSKGRLTANTASEILHRAGKCDVCLIGPGLGVSNDITELVQSIVRIVETPVVLDADGLNAIAGNISILSQAVCPLILTPHPGEFERLLGNSLRGSTDAPTDRLSAACGFASKYNCILVLKGHRTIIALPNGTAYLNTTGGPAMAKGGTGDVLAGMITALIAQKLPIVNAVTAAVFIHGLAGDMCAEKFGQYSVTASDIINMLPNAIKSVS